MRWRAAAALGALLLAAAAAIAAAAEAAAGVAAGRGGEGVGTGDDAATLDAVRLSEFERATLFTPEGLRRVHQVAATSAETGELADALPLYKLALVVAQRVHGGAHAATAAAASNLAGMHYTLGRHADAAEIYREAAKVYGRMGATERDVGYVTTLHTSRLASKRQATCVARCHSTSTWCATGSERSGRGTQRTRRVCSTSQWRISSSASTPRH